MPEGAVDVRSILNLTGSKLSCILCRWTRCEGLLPLAFPLHLRRPSEEVEEEDER
jgi:hypothetical protein